MSGFKSVFKPDGSMHIESEFGTGSFCTRMDLTTGETSSVLGSGPFKTVTNGNGTHMEYTTGNLRYNTTDGTTDFLL